MSGPPRGSLVAVLGPWLVVKQLLWSPPLQGVAPGAGVLAATAAVALAILGLALRLGGRAQLVALLALDAALTGVFQANLLYHRQFQDLASVAAFSFAAQTVEVGDAVRALLRPEDLLLWVDVAVLAGMAVLARGPSPAPLRARHANLAVAAAACLFAVPAVPLLDRPLTGPRHLALTRAEVASALNVVGYQLFDLATFARRRVGGASRDDLLREAIRYHRERPRAEGPLTGSQRGRNVVVVQLESVQAFAVGRRVGGVRVTPRLDALARESLHFTRAYSQVAQGTTSDAELLAGCSLLPLETGAVFTDRHDVDYRCLPELLREAGYHTVAMHANWPNFWNRERMYPAMGYDRFYELRDFDREPVIGLGLADRRFAEQAAEKLAALPEPFYAVLVTLTNHVPFDDPDLPRALPLGSLAPTMVGRYLDSVHYSDAALGVLLDRLRASGLLDRSVLVVYGDHHGVLRESEGTEALGLPTDRPDVWLEHERRIPLLVRLPGGAHAGARGAPAGQVDVAPTLADLLGLDVAGAFFHGRSLVSSPPAPVVLPDGSAVGDALVYLSHARRWGPPGCLDGARREPVEPERCEALAADAARRLALSRAEIEEDLFRWMVGAKASP
ncbi:MAG TPA: LTA synthase family protein [Anaeromyxobacteraceae bacterium]|nr:LTA synthase family protein [Anaeromyxobacteraceae bacterium]